MEKGGGHNGHTYQSAMMAPAIASQLLNVINGSNAGSEVVDGSNDGRTVDGQVSSVLQGLPKLWTSATIE
jgi:hypothetical protein